MQSVPRKNVELTFNGIGRLTIRDSRVKMRFYKEFITQMDGTGKLLDSMQNVSHLAFILIRLFELFICLLINIQICDFFMNDTIVIYVTCKYTDQS